MKTTQTSKLTENMNSNANINKNSKKLIKPYDTTLYSKYQNQTQNTSQLNSQRSPISNVQITKSKDQFARHKNTENGILKTANSSVENLQQVPISDYYYKRNQVKQKNRSPLIIEEKFGLDQLQRSNQQSSQNMRVQEMLSNFEQIIYKKVYENLKGELVQFINNKFYVLKNEILKNDNTFSSSSIKYNVQQEKKPQKPSKKFNKRCRSAQQIQNELNTSMNEIECQAPQMHEYLIQRGDSISPSLRKENQEYNESLPHKPNKQQKPVKQKLSNMQENLKRISQVQGDTHAIKLSSSNSRLSENVNIDTSTKKPSNYLYKFHPNIIKNNKFEISDIDTKLKDSNITAKEFQGFNRRSSQNYFLNQKSEIYENIPLIVNQQCSSTKNRQRHSKMFGNEKQQKNETNRIKQGKGSNSRTRKQWAHLSDNSL